MSFKCQGIAFPASALGSEYSTSGLIKRGLIVQDQIYVTKDEPAEQKPASKMPAMLKPLILPEQYDAKQIRTHAAAPHQTEVTLDTEKYNTQVVNLQIGPASKVMLLIGGLLAQASVFLIEKILAFLKRLLAAFGFGMRQSDLQKYEHPDKSAPALCFEPIQLALPAPKSAEDKAADELFRVVEALEKNDSSLLPVVLGAEKERAAVQAAMDEQGGKGGGTTTPDAENFGFTDEDFVSTNAVTASPKNDPMDDLKAAIAAHEVAARALKIVEIKDGPIHFTTVVQRQAELKIVREDLESARAKWDEFCFEHPFKSSLPGGAERKRLLERVEANEQAEKRAVNAVSAAEAEDLRIKKLYETLPDAIVPAAILQAEAQSREAIKTAREAIQAEAIDSIKAIRSDVMMSPKMAKFESLLSSSFKHFNSTTSVISQGEVLVLDSQIGELRRLRNAQEAARRATMAEFDGDANKPVTDGQTSK